MNGRTGIVLNPATGYSSFQASLSLSQSLSLSDSAFIPRQYSYTHELPASEHMLLFFPRSYYTFPLLIRFHVARALTSRICVRAVVVSHAMYIVAHQVDICV